jgi:hypothetical protein
MLAWCDELTHGGDVGCWAAVLDQQTTLDEQRVEIVVEWRLAVLERDRTKNACVSASSSCFTVVLSGDSCMLIACFKRIGEQTS